jgi:hypothetical protein
MNFGGISCCCDGADHKILIDGTIRTNGLTTLTRLWGDYLNTYYESVGKTVEFYEDVAGVDFDLNDYGLLFVVLPCDAGTPAGEYAPDWWSGIGTWNPTVGPKRICIFGDALGDSPAPDDYGTAVADTIANSMTECGMTIGADSQLSGADDVESIPLTAGVTELNHGQSSEVLGGSRIGYIDSGGEVTLCAHNTSGGISFVLFGTPTYVSGAGVAQFLQNLWDV